MRWRWPVAAALGAGVAAVVAVVETNRRWRVDGDALEAAGRTLPEGLVDHYVTTDDGGRIHAVERGQGPPIVLVHGVTLGVATWAPQLRRLADGHRVIALGQRGHGRSLAGEGGYSLERLADDLLEVLDALEVAGAVLVGHSMGGMVSLLAAVRRPDDLRRHVAGLVLLATSAGPLVPGPMRGRLVGTLAAGAERGFRRAEQRGGGLLPVEELGPLFTRASFGARPAPADIELTRTMVAAMSPTAMSGLLPGLLSYDVSRGIGAIDLPTWVVVGSRDMLTPPRMARAMAAAIPGAKLVVFEGCGHMVMLEREDALDDLLERVSAEVAAPR